MDSQHETAARAVAILRAFDIERAYKAQEAFDTTNHFSRADTVAHLRITVIHTLESHMVGHNGNFTVYPDGASVRIVHTQQIFGEHLPPIRNELDRIMCAELLDADAEERIETVAESTAQLLHNVLHLPRAKMRQQAEHLLRATLYPIRTGHAQTQELASLDLYASAQAGLKAPDGNMVDRFQIGFLTSATLPI